MCYAHSILIVALLLIPIAHAQDANQPDEHPGVLDGFEKRALSLPGGKEMSAYSRHGDGPDLVLVPGTWGDVHRFAPLIARLPQDMPMTIIELSWQGGHVPPTLDMTIESLADDVLGVIHALDLTRYYIGGHSIGGMIAVEIAGRNPAGLAGAIPMEGWTHHSVVHTAFNGVVTGELTPQEKAQSEAERIQGRAHLTQEQSNAIGQIWKGWNGYDALMRAEAPILEVWGDRGKPHADRNALQIPDRANIEIAWMPDASHMIMLETPDELAAAIVDFTTRHH